MQNEKTANSSLMYLIDMLVDDMKLLSWVREEIAQLLVQTISVFAKDDRYIPLAEHLLQQVAVKQLLAHTPEGVAVWLQVRTQIPDAKLPKHIWHHRDPLSKKEIPNVAQIMQKHKGFSQGIDSTKKRSSTGERQDSPHFAWNIILRHLAEQNDENNPFAQKGSPFKKFWTSALDSESNSLLKSVLLAKKFHTTRWISQPYITTGEKVTGASNILALDQEWLSLDT